MADHSQSRLEEFGFDSANDVEIMSNKLTGVITDTERRWTYILARELAPTDYYKFQNYDVLYNGRASKATGKSNDEPTIYLVSTEDTTFALTRTRQSTLCGFTLIHTEHPKLFVLEVGSARRFKSRSSIPINNLDIFTYANSKFVYVEKHLKRQIVLGCSKSFFVFAL